MISEGCEINGTVEHSVLSGGVIVEEGAVVRNSVIMEDVRICRGATIDYAIIDSDSVICEGAHVGDPAANKNSIRVIAKGSEVR